MIAIYVNYLIATKIPTNVQAQFKGRAPKVADWPRKKTESVVRFSLPNDTTFNPAIVFSGVINDEASPRTLVIDGSDALIEDLINSDREVNHIEDEPYPAAE